MGTKLSTHTTTHSRTTSIRYKTTTESCSTIQDTRVIPPIPTSTRSTSDMSRSGRGGDIGR